MTTQLFELHSNTDHKFWEVGLDENTFEVTIRYGKWNRHGTEKAKPFDDIDGAQAYIDKSTKGKLKAGYEPSDPEFPNHLRKQLAVALETGATDLSVGITSGEVFREICRIETLEKLRVSGATEVPAEIGNLVNLKSLDLEQNAISSLPPEIGKLAELRTLYMYSAKLTTLPDEIGDLSKLVRLVLWSNELTHLPDSLGKLSALEELDVHENKLTELPDTLDGLTSLEELDAHDNELTGLPSSMGACPAVEVDLSANPFVEFPLALTRCTKLETLDLSACGLVSLPDEIREMKALRVLTVDSSWRGTSAIAALPDGLFDLPALETLSLTENKITEIPIGIGRLPVLAELDLSGNPITNVPEDVVDQGKEAILTQLGLSSEVTLAPPPPEPERAAAVAAKADALKSWERKVKDRSWKDVGLDAALAFFRGETDVLPSARPKDHYHLDGVCQLVLAPVAEFSFIDERIVAFVTQDAWCFKKSTYHSGFYEDFFAWAGVQVAAEADEPVFGAVVELLRGAGLSHKEVLAWTVEELGNHIHRDDGHPTSVGTVLLAAWPEHAEFLVRTAVQWWRPRAEITALFVGQPGFGEHLDALLVYRDGDEGVVGPTGELEALIAHDPTVYLPHLEAAMERSTQLESRARLNRLLLEHYGDTYRERVFEQTGQILADIASHRNSVDRYAFAWTGAYRDSTAAYLDWVLTSFGSRAGEMVFAYVESTKRMDLDGVEVVAKHLGQDGLSVVAEALNMTLSKDLADHYRRVFDLLRPLDWTAYHDKAWELASCEFSGVRGSAASALAHVGSAAVEQAATTRLGSKDKAERLAGVLVLVGMDKTEPLMALVDSDKDDTIRDTILGCLLREPTSIDHAEALRRMAVASTRGKLKRPVKKWLDEETLPTLRWTDGTELTTDQTRWFLVRQNRIGEIELELEARDVYPLLDRESGHLFARGLLDLVLIHGGVYAKTRFALSVVGALGGEAVIEGLLALVVNKQNENAVRVLSLVDHDDALRALGKIIRIYRTKYPNVRELADLGLQQAAMRRGVEIDVLADQLVPQLGFVAGLRGLGAGCEVFLGVDRKLRYRVIATGKVTKSPPKTMSKVEKAEAKALAAELREVVRTECQRLEDALVTQRRWTRAGWDALFVTSVVDQLLAQGMLWGVYEEGTLSQAFRVTEDGGWVGVGGEPVQGQAIGLVHPLELSEADRDAWTSVFVGVSTAAAFSQLDRPTHCVAEEDQERTMGFAFEDREVSASTFKGRAASLGWQRGSVVDAGGISSYRKRFPTAGIEVIVKVEGLSISSWGEEPVTLGSLSFVELGSVRTGSYLYDEPRDASDSRLVALGEVPAVVFSETVANLERIGAP